jgi:hypothetical protein
MIDKTTPFARGLDMDTPPKAREFNLKTKNKVGVSTMSQTIEKDSANNIIMQVFGISIFDYYLSST